MPSQLVVHCGSFWPGRTSYFGRKNWPMADLTMSCILIHTAQGAQSYLLPQDDQHDWVSLLLSPPRPLIIQIICQTSSLKMHQFLILIIPQVWNRMQLQNTYAILVQWTPDNCQGYSSFRTSAKLARNLGEGSRERWLYDHGIYFKDCVGRSRQSNRVPGLFSAKTRTWHSKGGKKSLESKGRNTNPDNDPIPWMWNYKIIVKEKNLMNICSQVCV